jgi:exo-beta-1,3-glucanase (GH17 family)
MSYRNEEYHAYSGLDFTEHSGIEYSKYSTKEDLRKLWRATLDKGIHGICFSLYEDGQKPGDIISEAQVERRIKILKPYSKWIRSFSSVEGNEHIPRVAHKYGIKTLVGAWLGPNKEDNEKEIESLIAIAKEGFVTIAAVGNEVLYRNDLPLDELLTYIKRVKAAIPKDIPVGYVDAYYEFSTHPELVEISDVILANCYPYWEGCHIDGSSGHMQQMYRQALLAAQGKRVIITETGWPSEGGSLKGAFSSEENAIKYFINTQAWASKANIETFYFSSFDESWKVGNEGDVGAYWGLWDKNEVLKF